MTIKTPQTRPAHLIIAALMLVLLFELAVGSALRTSPTVGEVPAVARGWWLLHGAGLLPADHPPLPDLLGGLGARLEPTLPPPGAVDAGAGAGAEDAGRALLSDPDVALPRAIFLARFPTILLSLLLGALLFRWACEALGGWAGVMAAAVYALSPNLLAFAGQAAPDFAGAAFYVLAVYAWTRYLRAPSTLRLIAGGLAAGLALACGFGTLLLIPTFVVLAVRAALGGAFRVRAELPGWLRIVAGVPPYGGWAALLSLIVAWGVGLILLAAVYAAFGAPPLAAYRADLARFLGGPMGGGRTYLLGRFAGRGWWYGPLVVLGAKLPLPMLLLVLFAATLAATRGVGRREGEILLSGLLYLGLSLLIPVGPALRHLLPVLLFGVLFVSRLGAGPLQTGWLRPASSGALVTLLAAANLLVYPDYLTVFNVAVGGPENATRLLVRSNLDWGQDLPALCDEMAQRGGVVHLAYFGGVDPAAYDVDYVPLPVTWPAGDGGEAFHPLNPAPGLYAISATHLVGATTDPPDLFGYFRERPPLARAGGSIYLYDVPPLALSGDEEHPPWFAQCAITAPVEREETLTALTGLPDLYVYNFDCAGSLAFGGGVGWMLLPAGVDPIVPLGPADYTARFADGSTRYRVWQVDAPPEIPASRVEFPAVQLPLPIAGRLALLGYEVDRTVAVGDELVLTTYWRVRQPPPPPVTIFARLESQQGAEVAAADALGVVAEYWRPGMVIVQQHRLPIGPDVAPGNYVLTTGLVSTASGERFPVSQSGDRIIDRIVLRNVEVTGGL
jgi:hypothetical protein